MNPSRTGAQYSRGMVSVGPPPGNFLPGMKTPLVQPVRERDLQLLELGNSVFSTAKWGSLAVLALTPWAGFAEDSTEQPPPPPSRVVSRAAVPDEPLPDEPLPDEPNALPSEPMPTPTPEDEAPPALLPESQSLPPPEPDTQPLPSLSEPPGQPPLESIVTAPAQEPELAEPLLRSVQNPPSFPPSEPASPPLDLFADDFDVRNPIQERNGRALKLGFSVGTAYDDNIFAAPSHKQGDEISILSGAIAFAAGDYQAFNDSYVVARYRIDGFLFANHSERNAANHLALLRTQFRAAKLIVQTESRYEYLTGADRRLGDVVTHHYLDNIIRLLYDVNAELRPFISAEQIVNLYDRNPNSFEYVLRGGADYAVTPKIKLGAETALGDIDQSSSPTIVYGQIRLHLAYEPSEKFQFQLSAGGEVQHFESDGVKATPVFSLDGIWRPLVSTAVSLSAYRQISPSGIVESADYVGTGAVMQLSVWLFPHLKAGIAIGFEHDSYVSGSSSSIVGSNRQDNYVFTQPSVTYKMTDRLSAALSYEFSRNASSEPTQRFSDNRVAVQVGISF